MCHYRKENEPKSTATRIAALPPLCVFGTIRTYRACVCANKEFTLVSRSEFPVKFPIDINSEEDEISIAKNMLLRAFVEAQEMLKQYRDEDLHQEHDDVGFLPALGVGSGYGGQSDSNNATPEFAVVPTIQILIKIRAVSLMTSLPK